MERKVALCYLLLDTAAETQEAVCVYSDLLDHVVILVLQMSTCRKLLSEVIAEAHLIIALLTALQPAGDDTGDRATKRARLEQYV